MQPGHDEIRDQLGRILASESFVNSARLSRFLRFVVEQAIAGNGGGLKEYSIGVEVFERDDRYDPRMDSIVRVEAGRLRSKLDEYYRQNGAGDPVIVRMRRGSYVPEFELRQATQASAIGDRPAVGLPGTSTRWRLPLAVVAGAVLLIAIAAWRGGLWTSGEPRAPGLTIAVLPFASYSADQADTLLAARVTDGITAELARLGTLGVVSHTSALQFAGARRPLREIASTLGADVVAEGSVQRDGERVRVDVRLVDAARDRKIWVENFAGRVTDLADLQRRIAAATATAATQPRTR